MIECECLCGAVRVTIEEQPDIVVECNCTLCAKSGARWGYFYPDEVTVAGVTRGWVRRDKAVPNAEIHFCPACGATTHYVLTPAAIAKHGNVQMGVNMALAEPADLAGVELCFPDGRAWSGEGDFGYVRESRVLAA